MPKVSGAKSWRPAVAAGLFEWQLGYRCPDCGRQYVLSLQPGGWQAPVVPDGEDATGVRTQLGATTAEVARWEARRAAGQVEHEDMREFPFEVWCSICQKGATVTLTE